MTATEVLARLVAIPLEPDHPARRAARRTIVNAVAVALAGSHSEAAQLVFDVTPALGSGQASTVIGRAERLPPRSAALVNGVATHVDDFDDTHFATIVHPGASVVPAALAIAEYAGRNGAALVDAVAVGVETALQVGLMVSPVAFDAGWHISGIGGPVGAAAAAARLLGLEPDAVCAALTLASAQAAGTQEALGTMTKSLHLGKAAFAGVEAALLAESGLVSPEADGVASLVKATSGREVDGQRLLEPRMTWEIEHNAFKPYACGVVSHAAIDAAIAVGHACDWRDVQAIAVRTNPVVLDVMGETAPTNELEAKFSVYHAVAVGLRYGAAGPLQYLDEVVVDPVIDALRRLIQVDLDLTCRVDEAELTVRLVDGTEHRTHIAHARSSPESPLTDDDLREKAQTAAGQAFGSGRVARLVDELFALDQHPSLSCLFADLTPLAGAA